MVAGAVAIKREWQLLGESAAELNTGFGVRTPAEQAAFDACFVHIRCLINFLCGDYKAHRSGNDITPSDFLGRDWWPDDAEDLDRNLRGRLRVINREVLHLSWGRVDATEFIWWSMVFLVRLTHHSMCLFLGELEREAELHEGVGSCLPVLYDAQASVEVLLPAWDPSMPQTAVELAPPRPS